MLRGRELVQQNQLSQAVEVCRNGLLAEPSVFEGRLILGAALMGLGRYDEVLSEMEIALSRVSDHPQALALHGEALMNMGRYGEARQQLSRALERMPNDDLIRSLYDEAELHAGAAPAAPRPPERTVNVEADGVSVIEERPTADGTDSDAIRLSESDVLPLTGDLSSPALELSDADLLAVDAATDVAPAEATEVQARNAREITDEESEEALSLPAADTYARTSHDAPEGEVIAGTSEATAIYDEPFNEEPATQARDAVQAQDVGMFEIPPASGEGPLPPDQLDELFPDDERGVSRMANLAEMEAAARAGEPAFVRNEPAPPPMEARRPVPRAKGPASTGPAQIPEPIRPVDSHAWNELASSAALNLDKVARPTPARSHGPKVWFEGLAYVVLAAVVMAAAGVGGLYIRHWRLEKQIDKARQEAQARAAAGTLAGYQALLSTEERVAAVADGEEGQALRARYAAAIAFEFQVGTKKAEKAVEAVKDSTSTDSLVARAYWALVQRDVATAMKLAADLEKQSPTEREAGYIRGQAALLGGDLGVARTELTKAASALPRATTRLSAAEVLARLGEAKLALELVREVEAASPDYPRARLARASLLVAHALPGLDVARELGGLEAVIADRGATGAWAALTAARLAQLGGQRDASEPFLVKAQALGRPLGPRFQSALAETLRRQGNWDAARTVGSHVLADWPASPWARGLKAEIALREGRTRDAETLLEKAMSADELVLRGQVRAVLGDDVAAAEDFGTVLERSSTHRMATYGMAEVEIRAGKLDEAATRIEPLFEAGSRAEVAVLWARILRLRNDAKGAEEVLAKAYSAVPPSSVLVEQAALAAPEARTKLLENAVKADPTRIDARLALALRLREQGMRQPARRELDVLTTIAARNAEVLLHTADLHVEAGDHAGARQLLARVSKLSDAAEWAWWSQRVSARMDWREGQVAEAIRGFERAKELRPDDVQASLYLTQLYAETGNLTSLGALLEELEGQGTKPSVRFLAKGIAALFGQRAREAERTFRSALSAAEKEGLPPQKIALHEYWLGRAVHEENPKRALPFFQKALKRDPQFPGAHYYVGHTFYDAGDYAQAAESYELVLQLDPIGFPKAYFFLGTSLVDVGKREAAERALNEFVKRAPSDIDVPEAKSILASMKKK